MSEHDFSSSPESPTPPFSPRPWNRLRGRAVIWKLAGGVLAFGVLAVGGIFLFFTYDLPKLNKLDDYSPSLVTELYSAEGTKFAEFSNERRFLVPVEKVPRQCIEAFVSSEDSGFFRHTGIDYRGIARAFFKNMLAGRIVQGGSTITQQVAKSLLLSSERSYKRKIREIILARRIEERFSKEEILYLYLNQIYLGHAAYGIQAASENYFHKDVAELSLSECSFLAGLPQAPSRYSPFRSPTSAKERQIYVLRRMAVEGYVPLEEAEKAIAGDLKIFERAELVQRVGGADYAEHIRRYVQEKYGSDALYAGGLKVYAAMNLDRQKAAETAVRAGLDQLDQRQGFRGAIAQVDLENATALEEWIRQSEANLQQKDFMVLPGVDPKTLGKAPENPEEMENTPAIVNAPAEKPRENVVLEPNRKYRALVQDFEPQGQYATLSIGLQSFRLLREDMRWGRHPDPDVAFEEAADYVKDVRKRLKKGDVILVTRRSHTAEELRSKKYDKDVFYVALAQDPVVQGALVSIDPANGATQAMVGGYDFRSSEFNRAVQSLRQPGSSFKPIIYSAAIDKGYTASSILVDSPIVYQNEAEAEEESKWRPKNYGNKFLGDTPLRKALIKSMNVITIKVLQDVGIDYAAAYARKLGISTPLNRDLSFALGSSDVSLLELTTLYSVFPRQGRRVSPVFITRIVDSKGNVLEENPFNQTVSAVEAENATRDNFRLSEQERDILYHKPPAGHVITPQTAFLMTQLLQDVVTYGTGQRARALGRPAGGKTGTTNDESDVWFMGFTPDLVTGVWVGYDLKKPLGRRENGGRTAAPIWVDYMKSALANSAPQVFNPPPGIVFAMIDRDTGYLARSTTPPAKRVRAAFLEGTEPTTAEPPKSVLPEDQFELLDSANPAGQSDEEDIED